MTKAKGGKANLSTQTLIDPFSNVVPSSTAKGKKDPYPEVKLPAAEGVKLDRYFVLKEEIKTLDAEKVALYNDVKAAAFDALIETHWKGDVSNIKILGKTGSALFICQNKGRTFGLAEKQEFSKAWGDKAAAELLKIDEGGVKVNIAVWNQHKDDLLKALNAVDAKGNRMVPESVVASLFSVSLKVTETVVEDSRKFCKNKEQLSEMYKALGLVTALKE